jgi:hypothetical protein
MDSMDIKQLPDDMQKMIKEKSAVFGYTQVN